MINNTIAHVETGDARSDLNDLTHHIYAENKWIFEPGEDYASTLIL
jgi:hypothetical protein